MLSPVSWFCQVVFFFFSQWQDRRLTDVWIRIRHKLRLIFSIISSVQLHYSKKANQQMFFVTFKDDLGTYLLSYLYCISPSDSEDRNNVEIPQNRYSAVREVTASGKLCSSPGGWPCNSAARAVNPTLWVSSEILSFASLMGIQCSLAGSFSPWSQRRCS